MRQTAAGILGVAAAGCGYQSLTALVPGVAVPFLTPTDRHYMKNGAEGSIAGWRQPRIDPESWRLTIDGLVDRPLTISLAELGPPRMAILKTLQCVVDSNSAEGLVGTGLWGGVPLYELLDRAGLQPETQRLRFFGADGFTNNLPLDRLRGGPELPPVLLVTHMNGEPLPAEHGAPVRLLVPDGFGYASIKWLTRIEATADTSPFGTYQDTGFTNESRTPISSRITAPLDNLRMPAGVVTVHGVATSGFTGVDRVEVAVGDGPWLDANLATEAQLLSTYPELSEAEQFKGGYSFPFTGVWVPWSFAFDAAPGRYTIRVRAVDRFGQSQPERDTTIADGITAWPSVRVEVA